MSLKKPNNASDGIGGHRVIIREIEAMLSARIYDLFCRRPYRFGQPYMIRALGERNVTIGITMEFE